MKGYKKMALSDRVSSGMGDCGGHLLNFCVRGLTLLLWK